MPNTAQQPKAERRQKRALKRYGISYAYEIPYYFDFVIEARSEKAALTEARKALKESKLDILASQAQPCYENQCNDRVFSTGLIDGEGDGTDTLEKVLEAANK